MKKILFLFAMLACSAFAMAQLLEEPTIGVRVGDEMTDVSLPDMEGNSVKLSDYVGQGNYVLVDFWASWCGPCRMEMPNVKAAYKKYHKKGFEIVGISLDVKKEAWAQAVKDLGITWPQMGDLKGWKCEGSVAYGVRAIPATVLFDPKGKVVEVGLRGEALMRKLEAIYE